MTDYIQNLYTRFITNKEHKELRQQPAEKFALAEQYASEGLSDNERSVRRLAWMLENEKPVVYPDEKIALLRTVPVVPEIFTEQEWAGLREKYFVHEQGKVFNIAPEYSVLLESGFDEKIAWIDAELAKDLQPDETEFLAGLKRTMEAIISFCDRYREEAERVGNKTVADTFSRIPRKKAETFLEALQFLRVLHYCLWCSFNYHNTIGRFDQFMLPYLQHDLAAGVTQEEAQDLLEEFFLSCNKDSDLYVGMQQGDNGQTIVLGGLDLEGNDCFNDLSEMCLKACEDLRLIDPKINLRVNKKTPLSVYERGTHLTKLGLGFPQYANDDVVIPCLLHWGYDKEDAYNYSVAACWEFIIPGYGMDIPNVNGLSFTKAFNACMPELEKYGSFDEVLSVVKAAVKAQAEELMATAEKPVYMEPAPLMSLMMRSCLENHKDISFGGKYNNFGLHGSGLATAVDSLAALRKYLYTDKKYTAQEIRHFTETDYADAPEALHDLRFEAPKFGNDDDATDALATELLDCYADALEGRINSRGGIWRAGTGSAMYYVWHSAEEPATPDGRRKGENIACNYSPSLFARCSGPVSIVKSFAKPHLERCANGGPLTIELHDSIFRNDESISKVAMFIKSFIDLGGHQMQINAVNRDTLKDAKLHPENYKNLIVRVWGWSGYFVELDEVYQDHIMERMELCV